MTDQLHCALVAAFVVLVAACGSSQPQPNSSNSTHTVSSRVRQPHSSDGARPTEGSSDGMTCEEARDANVEEVNIGAPGSAPDLTAKDLGAVLNDGSYLNNCSVPQDAKINVCAAVKGGTVVGVTVAMLPHDPELEKCVAKEVRSLAFPSHPKMDIVRTEY